MGPHTVTVPLIAVSAVEHPELDDWVRERAAEEASRSGVQLGEYLGREDWLGEQQPPDLCCHLFTTIEATRNTTGHDSDCRSIAWPGELCDCTYDPLWP